MTLSEKLDIPLFPLSLFLLPGERSQLHIFEPRYRQMFAELLEGDGVFGIPYSTAALTMGIGSRCRLVKVLKDYDSGESDVLIECEGLFKLTEFQSMRVGKLYPYGSVNLLRTLSQEIASERTQQAYAAFNESLSTSEEHFKYVDSEFTLVILASLQMGSEEKHRFVQLNTAEQRDKNLYGLIKQLSFMMRQEEATEHGIYLS